MEVELESCCTLAGGSMEDLLAVFWFLSLFVLGTFNDWIQQPLLSVCPEHLFLSLQSTLYV